MINVLVQVDLHASAGRSVWHRCSALAKLVLAFAAIGISVFSPSLVLQAALYAGVWVLVLGAWLPLRLALAATTYPLLFVTLVLIARWDGSVWHAASTLLRPLTASLIALWLVGTTPYPDLFAPLSRVLPRGAADGLFLTYRALFEFLARAERVFRALHLRGGDRARLPERLMFAGEGLGTLVLYGFERSQRMYATMLLRGHSGRICGCRHWAEWTRADLAVAAAGVLLAVLCVLLWNPSPGNVT